LHFVRSLVSRNELKTLQRACTKGIKDKGLGISSRGLILLIHGSSDDRTEKKLLPKTVKPDLDNASVGRKL